MNQSNSINAHVESRTQSGELTGVRDIDYLANRNETGSNADVSFTTGSRMRICVHAVARDANGCITGVYDNPFDLGTVALANLMQTNIFDTAESITDVTDTARSIAVNSASTVLYINAGTGTTAAAFTDYKLTTTSSSYGSTSPNTSYQEAGTVNAISSNTFTVTGTITNTSGATITYSEVGMSVTVSTYQFLISHDVFTGLSVSNNGTLAVTYTLTFT